jgi:hypothetical protein
VPEPENEELPEPDPDEPPDEEPVYRLPPPQADIPVKHNETNSKTKKQIKLLFMLSPPHLLG